MRLFLFILFLAGILYQPIHTVLVLVDYEVNKEYITVTYCENKANPSMKCHGKCHAMKKLNGMKKELPAANNDKLGPVYLFLEKTWEHGLISFASAFRFTTSDFVIATDSFNPCIYRPPGALNS
jgi:hypothetical protein